MDESSGKTFPITSVIGVASIASYRDTDEAGSPKEDDEKAVQNQTGVCCCCVEMPPPRLGQQSPIPEPGSRIGLVF